MSNSFDQTPVTTSKAPEQASNFVRATGRTRKAGYWICGAGVAVLLSAFLPWVSMDGMDASHPTGSAVLMLLAIGGLLTYFGSRILQDRLTKAINVTLWVIAGVDILLCVGVFAAAGQMNSEGGGYVSVQPAIGFYLGVAGFIAGVLGTVLVQNVRRKNAAIAQPAENDR